MSFGEKKALEQASATWGVPDTQNKALQAVVAPHLDSFNYFLGQGLSHAIPLIGSRYFADRHGNSVEFWIDDVQIAKPAVNEKDTVSVQRFVYPSECRERGLTYSGKIQVTVSWRVNDGEIQSDTRVLGQLPLMVRSDRCNLKDATPAELIRHHEDAEEMGGTFIVNGNERLIRMLIVTRRNYAMSIVRSSFKNRGPGYSEFAVTMRCCRPDQSSITLGIHYLDNGDCTARFSFRKQEYLVPAVLILKALIDTSDREIYDLIVQNSDDTFISERVELMLREFKPHRLITRAQCLAYLGKTFRVAFLEYLPAHASDEQFGDLLLDQLILVHLRDRQDKFNTLIFLIRKLYATVSGEGLPDNADSPMHHEILLPGHLYLMYVKEKLDKYLSEIRRMLGLIARMPATAADANLALQHGTAFFKKALAKLNYPLGPKMAAFLATGNLITDSGLDLQQTTGYTIVAERLNFFRYLSHFASVHRGAFFAELKTTAVRKLLPEAWGFLCPVHTPDGAPCGLLNHLSHSCHVVTEIVSSHVALHLHALLCAYGMVPVVRYTACPASYVPVLLDGRVLGHVADTRLAVLAAHLRATKMSLTSPLPWYLEVGHVPVHPTSHPQTVASPLAGLFIATTPARMMRPVRFLSTHTVEHIGILEQVYLSIACDLKETLPAHSGFTHCEVDPTSMLSLVANLTPFSDFNQSPRNMYQCQMGKQSMAIPTHAWPHRTDNKLYRLQNPQLPSVRPQLYDHYGMDRYPNGANAVVAVISYTSYDMEDAMILNKASFERGFGHGSIFKSEWIDLNEGAGRRRSAEGLRKRFGLLQSSVDAKWEATIDADGLPLVGARLSPGAPFYGVVDAVTQTATVERYKGMEEAIVHRVRVLANENAVDTCIRKINVTLRVPRQPVIGDKFSSRHGQKGVCSQIMQAMNMPFSETGMTPDVIINPHAFPSRMTIGMLLESMAAKSAALHGLSQDATPFRFGEHRGEQSAQAYFGAQLKAAGYNYHGNEPMYSGVTGEEFRADIYLGVVYYQRLRHMVSDKYQVRTTGPVHHLTQQPVKGRKRAGGIRFGEMERDSLLAHGASFLLHDRLMNCSDKSYACICKRCGSVLSPLSTSASSSMLAPTRKIQCKSCRTEKHIDVILLPYVFRYLATELLAMNIDMTLHVK